MITCHLTKLETAIDQTRKAYPKLSPTDAALLGTALTLTGRHAIALYEGEQFQWTEDNERLFKAMSPQIQLINEAVDTEKKKTKSSPEEEPVTVTVGLTPNLSAGEKQLEGRADLKALLSEALQGGVEFVYSPTDIGWQWALDRVNWNTITGEEIQRKVKVKASFTEGAVGIEMGSGGAKKRRTAKAKKEAEETTEEEGGEE